MGEAVREIGGRKRFFTEKRRGAAPDPPLPSVRSGPLRGTIRYAGGFGCAEGDGSLCGAVPVPFAGKGKGVRRRGKVVVDGEKVKEVVVRAAGKAVDLVALGIEAHGGVPVKVGRVQTAEPLAGIDAPVIEVVDDPGTERVEGVGHGKRLLSGSGQEYCSIPPRRPAKRSGAVVYLNISIRGKRGEKAGLEKVRKIGSKKFIVPQNVGIEVNENGKNGRGGKAGIARGEVGVCTGRSRRCTGGSWNRTGKSEKCGRFSPRKGRFAAVFQGKRPENGFPVEKWAAVSAQWPGTGVFSEGSSDVVSCRPSPSVFGLRRFFVGGLPF